VKLSASVLGILHHHGPTFGTVLNVLHLERSKNGWHDCERMPGDGPLMMPQASVWLLVVTHNSSGHVKQRTVDLVHKTNTTAVTTLSSMTAAASTHSRQASRQGHWRPEA
jgi:hypothetical protein